MKIEFRPITDFKPGQIQSLVETSYAGLITCFPSKKDDFYRQWESEDQAAFQNPENIGRHILFSCIDDIPVGFFAWDHRQFPTGIIGQNCILPDYRKMGYGTLQVEKIIEISRDSKIETLTVETGDHDFFIPAHKMYQKCGFVIKGRRPGELFDIIEYALELNPL